ncbi:hypothetical protein [Oceanobacillus jeddahense]|uniref:t-SNARE coiled-coil homology domain-containing protein n=1 Tax=Oceanobacillus jeddahense TaxID=1462527 RepID=A0ABY5JVM4_9BACI|nr:hypothetical protein [Oceanobacillus jeddahense]UUI04423.1 hypothetical protein NP439_07145 [Oceanobacillus jeddahense]
MKFEEEVLKLLGELNTRQIKFEKEVHTQFERVDERFEQVDKRLEQMDERFEQVDKRFEQMDKRFDKFEIDLTEVKEKTDLTHQEVISLREDMTTVKDNDRKMKEEQEYQLSKWVDLDRRVDKLERKVLS